MSDGKQSWPEILAEVKEFQKRQRAKTKAGSGRRRLGLKIALEILDNLDEVLTHSQSIHPGTDLHDQIREAISLLEERMP